MQKSAKRFSKIMSEKRLESAHQVGDYVVIVFPPAIIRNVKIEAVKFTKSSLYYDVSIKMKKPDWEKPYFTNLTEISSAFICKEGQENELI